MLTNSLLRLFGAIQVVEEGNIITVHNLNMNWFKTDLKNIWNTNRIYQHMFTYTSNRKIMFNKFFAVEFYFILKSIRNSDKRTYTKSGYIDRVIEELYENTWLRSVKHILGDINNPVISPDFHVNLNWGALNQFNLPPLPEQKRFFEHYYTYTKAYGLAGYYLTAAAGAGKTATALMLRAVLGLDKLIAVVPGNTMDTAWLADIEKFYKVKPKIWHSQMNTPVDTSADVIIIHYQYLDKFIQVAPQLAKYRSLLVLDEGHNFNDIKSSRTQLFMELSKTLAACNDVLWMSGTPIKAIGTEAIPFLCTVTKDFSPQLVERFKKMYGTSSQALSGLLSNRLGIKTFTVKKTSFMPTEPIFETIKVTMPTGDKYTLESIGEEMAVYIKDRIKYYKDNFNSFKAIYDYGISTFEKSKLAKELETEYLKYRQTVALLAKSTNYNPLTDEMMFCNRFEKLYIEPLLSGKDLAEFRNAKSVIKYVMLKIRGECLGRILGKRREECHAEMVKYAALEEVVKNGEKKTILFTSYKEVVRTAMDYFKDIGMHPVEVTGDNSSDLKMILEKFQNSKHENPIIATLQSLSTGVPMTMASVVVFINKPFRVHEYEQAIARAWRRGNDSQIYVFNLELDTGEKPNINTRSNDIMEWSREQVNILTGTTVVVSIEGEFVDIDSIFK